MPEQSTSTEKREPQPNEVPSVNPIVDAHDRLWSEIDVLDDVAEMANQTKQSKSFFGQAHAESIEKLRNAQTELAQIMTQIDQRHDKSKYRSIWE
jgi:chromatin segregation and condensation protein Rec8/ScpA/Scc1 (kleisin family)